MRNQYIPFIQLLTCCSYGKINILIAVRIPNSKNCKKSSSSNPVIQRYSTCFTIHHHLLFQCFPSKEYSVREGIIRYKLLNAAINCLYSKNYLVYKLILLMIIFLHYSNNLTTPSVMLLKYSNFISLYVTIP